MRGEERLNIDAKELWGDETPFDISDVFRSCLGYAGCPGWGFIQRTISGVFGGFKGLNVIELGCGEGKVSLLFSLLGAGTTLVDYSSKQLERARRVAEKFEVEPIIINDDILNLPHHHRERYDVSMSFGTAEHFFGNSRQQVFNVHYNVIKKGGLSIIWVPNRYAVLFRLGVFLRKVFQRPVCPVDEIPFTRKELFSIAKTAGYNDIVIAGGSSIKNDFFNFIIDTPRMLKMPNSQKKFVEAQKAKAELFERISNYHTTINPIANYFCYPLVLVGQRL
jgi:SAM-dependent methyltransferase